MVENLGTILWDFNSLTTTFENNKKSIVLRCISSSKSMLMEDVQICQFTDCVTRSK